MRVEFFFKFYLFYVGENNTNLHLNVVVLLRSIVIKFTILIEYNDGAEYDYIIQILYAS